MLIASQVAAGKPAILHWPRMSVAERRRQHGIGTHKPIAELTVGQPTTVKFEFRVGAKPVSRGGRLLVVWRWPFDWSDLQTTDPTAEGYVRLQHVSQDGRPAVDLSAKYNWIAGIEPWHHQLQVTVAEELLEGDLVRVVCGDTSQGGDGWRAPTCVADRCQFLMLIDHLGDGRRNRLVPTPDFSLRPGPPARLSVIVPSDAVVGEGFEATIRADDCWGNPTRLAEPPVVSIDGQKDIVPAKLAACVRPVYHCRVSLSEHGSTRLTSRATVEGLSAVSNPVTAHRTRPPQQLVWGDLHSGQTEIGCGSGSLADHYAFGRDCAALSFITHQANDHYVTAAEWSETRQVTDEFYTPGSYVPILGCEWSPLTKDGGDRNVMYGQDDPVLRRSDRFFVEDPVDPEPDIPTAADFHEAFGDRDVLVNIHVGGRMTNLEWYEPRIEKLCETHSTHGTVEWFFMDAIARGYRVGLTAGTDGVMGRPGACHPGRRLIRNLRGGLTAIYCAELSREAVWEALQQRRCYATTGERMRLWVDVNGQAMGSECSLDCDELTINVHVEGTHAIERVDVFRDVDCVASFDAAPLAEKDHYRFLWGGTERKGTARLQRVDWDGCLSVKNGELTLLDSVNFQALDDEARTAGEVITWQSKTAGNAAGIVVAISGDDRTTVDFATSVLQGSFSMAQLNNGLTIAAGGVNRFLQVGRAPDTTAARDFQLSHRMENRPGAYWVRVTQVDQSIAWSSPVYC